MSFSCDRSVGYLLKSSFRDSDSSRTANGFALFAPPTVPGLPFVCGSGSGGGVGAFGLGGSSAGWVARCVVAHATEQLGIVNDDHKA